MKRIKYGDPNIQEAFEQLRKKRARLRNVFRSSYLAAIVGNKDGEKILCFYEKCSREVSWRVHISGTQYFLEEWTAKLADVINILIKNSVEYSWINYKPMNPYRAYLADQCKPLWYSYVGKIHLRIQDIDREGIGTLEIEDEDMGNYLGKCLIEDLVSINPALA